MVAARPTRAPAVPNAAAAPPAKGVADGALGDEGAVPFVPFVLEPETRAKFAQVKRVALLL